MSDRDRVESSCKVSDEVHAAAADAVRLAKAELEKAQAAYENVRRQAVDRLKSAREASVGDLIDNTLATVRRYPGASISAAAILGFFLGRLFRR